jgi:hypothetical protein
MASSETDIVNDALLTLGEKPIFSLTDDMDISRAANGIYPNARDFVLAQHPWNRCVKFATLSKTPRNPGWLTTERRYSYEYLYPDNCLRILEPGTDDAKWEAGISTTNEAVIWSDVDGLTVRYIFRNTNVAQYSAWLVQTLSAYLSMKLSLALTAHRGKAADMRELYAVTLSQAKGMDGQEQAPVVFTPTTLTDDVRLGS